MATHRSTSESASQYNHYIMYTFSNDDMKLMKRMFTTEDQAYTRYILEEDHGFDLCVHSRNFLAGIPILTNISNAVRVSRRTIVLLTR